MTEMLLSWAVGIVVAMAIVAVLGVLMLFIIGSLGEMIRSQFPK